MIDEQVRQVYDAPVKKDSDWDIETMIDQVWHQLQGKVSRAAIQAMILEIIPRYENARRPTFRSWFIEKPWTRCALGWMKLGRTDLSKMQSQTAALKSAMIW